jgi:hypothetical protein
MNTIPEDDLPVLDEIFKRIEYTEQFFMGNANWVHLKWTRKILLNMDISYYHAHDNIFKQYFRSRKDVFGSMLG